MPSHRVYEPDERPAAEVLIAGRWVDGVVRGWYQHPSGGWVANVDYTTGPGQWHLSTTVPADRVRQIG